MSALYEKFAGNNAAAPVLFLLLFLVIVGGALYLTPRIARWIEQRQKKNPGFYEGMLTEDPNAPGKAGEDGDGLGGFNATGSAAAAESTGKSAATGSAGKETSADTAGEERHGTD